MEFSHRSVLLTEAVDALSIKENGVYVDATAGGGGHSAEILRRLTGAGRLYSIDQDPDAVETVRKRFEGEPRSTVLQGNFADMRALLGEKGVGDGEIDGILLDIGVSSHQLDTAGRGFSFHEDAPLDMRMSQSGTSAAQLVNTLEYGELAGIISRYGEEKFAGSIARGIVNYRQTKPIETTLELAEIIKSSVPQKVRREGHPARKTFQALRIAVNDELGALERGLEAAHLLLSKGGRLAVITFHSLEDRIVKHRMADWARGCVCPKDFPVCVCGRKPTMRVLGKPIIPSNGEITANPRSRSAKLRVCEKIF